MWFRVVSPIRNVEAIAIGRSICELKRLRKAYGGKRWRKLKGVATVKFPDGRVSAAELHWYEAHGVGRREMKIKRLLN